MLNKNDFECNNEYVKMAHPDGRPYNIVEEFRDYEPEDVKKIVKMDSFRYDAMLLNLQDTGNVGACIRTASICGVRKIVVYGRRKFDWRSCVGAQNYIDVERVSGIPNSDTIEFEKLRLEDVDYILDTEIFIDYVKRNNYLPIFIEQHEKSIPASTPNLRSVFSKAYEIGKTPLLVFGNESFGIPRNILETNELFEHSAILNLHQKGCMRSFNVSVCFGIVCYKIMEDVVN